MKTLICLAVLLTAPLTRADTSKLWDGKNRGMDLVAIGHKRVTVYLTDGRTTVVGIPILVEKPKAATPLSNSKPAKGNHGDHASQKR
ncbi:MAG: hypothetical protein ABS95_00015 [Verrucomicrobia bacterium SCN 57-15]|nr:MAG: hypothetical protein ABS95_00015 [Verrucomicrobia bacterium SCN 57-15]